MIKPLDVKGEKTSYTVSSLLPYTKYKFSISAKNDVGSSARSQVVICQTSESGKSSLSSEMKIIKTIIEFDFRIMWRITQTRTAEVDW